MGSTTHVDRPPVADPLDRAVSPGGPTRRMLGQAGIGSAHKRTHDCARPIRLKGSTRLVNKSTGEVRTAYASIQELDGSAWVPCGNRRAAACEPCSERYRGDAWQLITTGLAGGKGIPASVAEHPCTFATLTAPSFGPVTVCDIRVPAALVATSRCAPTAGRCGAAGVTTSPTRHSALRCVPTARTTRATWCGSGTPRSCGADSPSPCNAILLAVAACR